MKNKDKVHHVNQLIELNLMMCIFATIFGKNKPTRTSHTPLNYIKYYFAVNPLTLLFCKKLEGR